MDIHEIIRLCRAGRSNAEISRLLRRRRKTVRKYVNWAREQGFLEGKVATVEEVHARLEETGPASEPVPPGQRSSLVEHADEVRAMRAQGMEMVAICRRLEERHARPFSYEALRRLVRSLEGRVAPETFVRVEVAPGEQAQVDFGYAGMTVDAAGRLRKTWAFVMLLSHSRHQYAELVYDQRIETWLACHEHAFAFFGGVPKTIVVDNLKAAIIKACRDNPLVQRAYRELAEHYGFLIDPNPPATPRLKGKVEKGGVHYVKRNFLAGREMEPTARLNEKLLQWCMQTAGQRVHGTTRRKPVEVFEVVEREALLPLPLLGQYDLAVWKEVKLYRDCYVNFEKTYYSAPYRLVGEQLLLRGGMKTVRIYTADHVLVASHNRAMEPGDRVTTPDHLPPYKLPGLTLSREGCRAKAQVIGPATTAVVEEMLESRPVDKLRTAGRVLELAARYGPERLEQACARALHFGEPTYSTIAGALKAGTDAEPLPDAEPPPVRRPVYRFVRQVGDLVAALGM